LEALAKQAGAEFAAALQRIAEEEQQRWKEERQKIQEEWHQLELRKESLQDTFRQGSKAAAFAETSSSAVGSAGKSARSQALAVSPGTASGSSVRYSAEVSDILYLNVGGQERIKIERAALTQCEGSRLASEFCRGAEKRLPKDNEGCVRIDFSPAVFVPLVDHLRLRHVEALQTQQARGQAIPRQLQPPPPPFPDANLDEEFVSN
jgi:hypothetical protein